MSATGQSPASEPMQAAQARLDHLFRLQVRGNPDDAATGTLRSYIEHYRLQGQAPSGDPS